MATIQEWREKYPNAYSITITKTEIIIINNPPISKKQQKREKQNALKFELNQLSNITSIYRNTVNVPETQGYIKRISKQQKEKEERTRHFMDINFLNSIMNPDKKHFTYGLGNSPMSPYDKWKTEFECQKDKKPKSFESYRSKAFVPTDNEGKIIKSKQGRRILIYVPYNNQTLKNYKLIGADT